MENYFYRHLSSFLLIFLVGCSTPSLSSTPTSMPQPTAPTAATETTLAQTEPTPSPEPSEVLPAITYNEIKQGEIITPLETETWQFEAKVGDRVSVVVNSQFDSYLELIAPTGELMAHNDDYGDSLNAALIDIPVTQSGPHQIIIRGFGESTGTYALALTGGHPASSGGTIENDDTRTVLLSQDGLKWHYEGKQDTFLTITAKGNDGVDSLLSLYDPNGALLITDDDSGTNLDAEIIEFPLITDGKYTIRVQAIEQTGLATITVKSSATLSGGGTLTVGETRKGLLNAGRTHLWTFTGKAGQIVNLLLASSEFDTFLELRDSTGTILAENDDYEGSTDSVLDRFVLLADDTYTVVVRGLSDTIGGNYEIALDTIAVPTGGGDLEIGSPTEAVLLPGYVDNWFFEGEADSFVTIRATSLQLDTYLELYDADGNLLVEDDDSGGSLDAALIQIPLTDTGQYQIALRSSTETDVSGVYEITLQIGEDVAPSDQLTSGEIQAAILEAGEQHSWTIEATVGDFITIEMNSDTLDTHLSLFDEEGTLLTLNDDYNGTQAAIVNHIIQEDGIYRIVARAYSADEDGDYTILAQVTDQAIAAP